MGIFDRFPYSSTHEMNLDFMLGKATEIAEDMQTVTAGMAQVQAGLSAISEKTEQATQAAAQAAQSASSIEGSVTAAEEAAEEAQMHNESAQTWAHNAMTYKADCQRSATEAAASATSAAQAATAAAGSEDTVAQYAQAANASAQSAANNNDSAHQYANQASASASNATFHSSNAQTAATNAQTAATNANTSATNAAASADRAAFLKTDVETLHRMCTAAVDQAATEAVNAANSAAQAAATKTDVETLVESLPEDFTDLNNTVNQLSDEIVDAKGTIDELNGGSINLLDPSKFEDGKYLVSGGGLSDNANLTASGFFPVSGDTNYYLYRPDTYQIRVCFYTDNSEAGYIYQSLIDIPSGISTFTTPLMAAYARISTNKNMILNTGVYASDIRYYIPYQLQLSENISIPHQIDDTLTAKGKAADAYAVGKITSHVILPENCVKFGDTGMIANERLDISNGKVVTNSSNQTRTDFIPVTVGDYVQTCAIRDICLYNDQYEYLGYINLWSTNDAVTPPSTYSGNYASNITKIETVNGENPAYIRCWGRYDQYPPAITMLSDEPYKVLNLGDSIFGNNEKPWDLGTYIQNITGLKDANCGYGGTTARVIPSGNMSPLGLPSIVDCIVSEDFSPLQTPAYWANLSEYRYSVPTLLFGMVDFSKIEVITLAYGTNDWNSSTPLDNAENRLDTSTYKGGLRYAVENLQTKYPAITLVMLSPIFRYWSNASDYSTVDQDSDTRTNNLDLRLTDYVTAMQEVAEEYHLPFFNNYEGISLNKYTAPTWLRDGTHLNRGIGVDKMGHIVAREINQIY